MGGKNKLGSDIRSFRPLGLQSHCHDRILVIGLRTGFIEAKIRSLRVEFSRRLREMNKPSGSEGGKKKPWRFMDSLMFLRDCVIPRTTTSNLSVANNSIVNDNNEDQVRPMYFKIFTNKQCLEILL